MVHLFHVTAYVVSLGKLIPKLYMTMDIAGGSRFIIIKFVFV